MRVRTIELCTRVVRFCTFQITACGRTFSILLALRDVDQYVFDDIPENAASDERRKWIRGDAKAKAVIGLTLSDDYLQHLRGCSSARETWEAITNVFERHTLLNNLAARRQFYTVSMLPSEKVLVFINRVKQLAATLQSMSVEIDDKEIAMAVLNGLPPRFHSLIVALDAPGNEDKVFGLEFVNSRLLQEEGTTRMHEDRFRFFTPRSCTCQSHAYSS